MERGNGMDLTVTFKKGPQKQFFDVTEIRVGNSPISPIYKDEHLSECLFKSTDDITIHHSKGIFVIAKNTFSTIEFSI